MSRHFFNVAQLFCNVAPLFLMSRHFFVNVAPLFLMSRHFFVMSRHFFNVAKLFWNVAPLFWNVAPLFSDFGGTSSFSELVFKSVFKDGGCYSRLFTGISEKANDA